MRPRSPSLLPRDETVVPALCYDACNDAYITAQVLGKTNELCAPGSGFQEASRECDACIAANTPTSRSYTGDPRLEQFAKFCQGVSPNVISAVTVNSASLESVRSSYRKQASSLGIWIPDPSMLTVQTITTNTLVTMPNGSVASVSTTVTTTMIKQPAMSTSTASSTSFASTNSTAAPTAASPEQSLTTSPSRAWIVGPVIGFLVLAALVFGIFLRRYRRKRARQQALAEYETTGDLKGMYEKSQLHSDCIPAPPQPPPMELEGSIPPAAAEFPANEYPAAELAGKPKKSFDHEA